MAFKKGDDRINLNGRPRGSKNKFPIRDRIKAFVHKNFDDVQKQYEKLSARDRVMFMEKMLKYVTPQMQSIDSSVELKNQLENMSTEKLAALAEDFKNTILNESEY
jgi:hypothetical protein